MRKQLEAADWEDIGKKLTAHAAFRAQKLIWRTGNKEDLAKGLNPKDLAMNAIIKVIDGTRKWDPNRGPLLTFLKYIVDSDIIHLVESLDNRQQARITVEEHEDEDDKHRADKFEFNARSSDLYELMPQHMNEPERSLSEKQNDDPRVSRLYQAVAGRPELTAVLDAIKQVGEKPVDIAHLLDVTVSDVNNRLKRIWRLAFTSKEG